MKQNIRVPAVFMEKHGDQFVATAGMRLHSILKRSLVTNQGRDFVKSPGGPAPDEYEALLQHRREGFLSALATWPVDTVLELRMAARPNLASRTGGVFDVYLLVRVEADSKVKARARVVSRFLSLAPLVFTFMPEAEFATVTDEAGIRQALSPFRPTHAVAITRKTADILLASGREQQSAGFGKAEKKDLPADRVPHLFPWTPAFSDWSLMCTTLMHQLDPYGIIVRLRPSASGDALRETINENIRLCEWFLSTGVRDMIALERRTSMLRDALLGQLAALDTPCCDLGLFVVGPRPVDDAIINVVADAVTGPCNGVDGKSCFRGGSARRKVNIEEALTVDFFPEAAPFTVSEAAAAFRLPSPPDSDLTGMPLTRFRTAPARIGGHTNADARAIFLCENLHQGMRQPIILGTEDRMRHTFILGQTGTGKSTLMENMILQDIANGQGVAVIDPHGDLVNSILGRIPDSRVKDVVLFDVLDREYPIGMNILKWETLEERDLLIDELYLTVERLYNMTFTGGPAFEHYFRTMLKLLMGEKPRDGFASTVLELSLCFQDKEFRDWLKKSFSNNGDLDSVNEMEKVTGSDGWTLKNMAPYITSKLNRFFTDQTIRRIVGQEECLDFDKIMRERKVLLVNLGKGRFGNVVSAILANHIVARFKLAAMKRGDLPPEARPDYFLYVDECHNLPPENFCELLSEARKYRLGLVLATQYAAQLNKPGYSGDSLLAAILGNVGTKLTFRLGPEDAQLIAPMLHPVFSPLDVIGLSNWQGYAHTQINNEVTPPFSFRSAKTNLPFDVERVEKVREMARAQYGCDKGEVDYKISLRRIAWRLADAPDEVTDDEESVCDD